MSSEHLINRYPLQRPFRNMSSLFNNAMNFCKKDSKLYCILCNISLETNTQEHKCTFRSDDKDIIIKKYF